MTGVQTCALPIYGGRWSRRLAQHGEQGIQGRRERHQDREQFCARRGARWNRGSASARAQGLLRLRDHLHRGRSEEHTSELQSLMRISYAVFCLKKKKIL